MSKADLEKVLAQLKTGKRLDARKYAGTVKWAENPLDYQNRLRNEW